MPICKPIYLPRFNAAHNYSIERPLEQT